MRALVSPIISTVTVIRSKLEVKTPHQRRKCKSHLMHGHVAAETVTRTEAEGLEDIPAIPHILGACVREPSLWHERVGVAEVSFLSATKAAPILDQLGRFQGRDPSGPSLGLPCFSEAFE
jgi:hypothetical protein